jgi:hypothetical protein
MGIKDTNNNELVNFSTTASAVNEITVKNAATTAAPEISATGTDTNIDLKLTPKGSGKLDLDGIKFPNADGTSGQVLQTNGSGVLSFATPAGGKVLQVVSTTKDDTFSVTSSSFADVTGLSVSITPSSASNKILVMVSLAINGRAGVVAALAKLVRNSTDIFIGASAGSRTRASTFVAAGTDHIDQYGLTYLDSPNTTSATTYKIQFAGNNANSVHINKGDTDTDNSVFGRVASSITVMEIKG